MSGSREDSARGEPVQGDAMALHDEAGTLATWANVSFVAGGILVAAGIPWVIFDLASGEDAGSANVTLRLLPGGANVSGRF